MTDTLVERSIEHAKKYAVPDGVRLQFTLAQMEIAVRAALKAQASRIAELGDMVVELWHDSNSGHGALHECLGMTWEEYQAWVMDKATQREPGND